MATTEAQPTVHSPERLARSSSGSTAVGCALADRPLLLDAYSCAGIGADGFADAGFDVVCLDTDEAALALNPHHVVCGDALRLLADPGFTAQFAAIHASPPCQLYSATRKLAIAQGKGRGRAVDLLAPTIDLLCRIDKPWVVENVERSPLRDLPASVRLCGSSFGLKLQRHRLFLPSGFTLEGTPCAHEVFDRDPGTGKPRPWGVYYAMGDSIPSGGRTALSWEHGCDLMGVPYDRLPYHTKGTQDASWRFLCEGLPPAMTEHVGRALIGALT